MTMEATPPERNDVVATEVTVRQALGSTYDKFGFQAEAELIANIVRILDDPAKRELDHEDDVSVAVQEILTTLWKFYPTDNVAIADGFIATAAVRTLLKALHREIEMGWVGQALDRRKSAE